MAHGMLKVLQRGPSYLVTLVVVFSMTQNIGGLVGSALLGSYQTIEARGHLLELAERVTVGDAQAAGRTAASTRALAPTTTDPVLRAQQGGASLAASMTREANVLAFNDVFRLVSRLSLATGLLVILLMLLPAVRPVRRTQPA